jgi:maltooligosyltrehalose trehalohydrolase
MSHEPHAARGRRLPVGAELQAGGGAHFRVWAPKCKRIEVVADGAPGRAELTAEPGGYFSGHVPQARAGTLYRYRLDGGDAFPDPASRFQPQGPHGPSQVIDPTTFAWTDAGWPGRSIKGQVIYELHLGTFTPEGTWEEAARHLPALVELGITAVEVMPVAEFPGRFGWGYDGVDWFAPYHGYGTPDDMRRFVDRAHGLGLAVLLDVVYNHFGPDGAYWRLFADEYFSKRHPTPWGEAINYDGPGSAAVRELVAANAAYWVSEFHIDGLRLDACQNIYDDSGDHVLALVARTVRAAANGRDTIVIAETDEQLGKIVRPPERGGLGLDGVWNDDFHHSARVALTGHNEAYYSDFLGTPQELVSAVKWGFLYQGQWYGHQKIYRGGPAYDLPPQVFLTYLENHDQIAHSSAGLRMHALTSPGRHRAMTALMLLAPGTPMLFQGQEFSASAPFLYFADHNPDLAKLVRKGRAEFLTQFPSAASAEVQERLHDPADAAAFQRCKLDHAERERNAAAYALHRDLIRLRREDPVFSAQRPRGVDGAVLGERAFVLRFFGEDGDDRLLLVNLGTALRLEPAPEPLLAPPERKRWGVLWSSSSPKYGGQGTPPLDEAGAWRVPGEAAVVLAPAEATSHQGDGASGGTP